MKYNNFTEISQDLTEGRSIFHLIDSKHDEKDCYAWQQGVHDFGKWLDEKGFIVVEPPNKAYSGLGLLIEAIRVVWVNRPSR